MKIGSKMVFAVLAAAGLAVCADRAQAAATVTLLGDSGVRITTSGGNTSTNTVSGPYGTLPLPIITQLTHGVELDFTPTASFLATAHALPAGQSMDFDGKLDFYVNFDQLNQLTANIFEDGIWSKSGTGFVNVSGGIVVTAVDPVTHAVLSESVGNTFGAPTFNAPGTWKLFDQVSGFSGSYSAYKISIDNALFAQALLPGGDASIAKKDFTVILTTDGSTTGGGNIPEPASIGVLALGAMALLARRRRA